MGLQRPYPNATGFGLKVLIFFDNAPCLDQSRTDLASGSEHSLLVFDEYLRMEV